MLEAIRKNASSWGVKVIFGVIIVVFMFWGIGSFNSDPAVVAYVDDQPILIKDFNKAYEESLRLVRNQNPNVSEKELEDGGFRRQVFGQLLNTVLLEKKAQELHIAVSPEELRTAIGQIEAFQNEKKQFDPERYQQLLTANDLTPGEFESDYARQLLLDKLMSYIGLPASVSEEEAKGLFDYVNEQATISYIPFKAADFTAGFVPTDEQIKNYYDAHKDAFKTPYQIKIEYAEFTPTALSRPDEVTDEEIKAYYQAHEDKYQQPEMVEARHILVMVPPGSPDNEVQAAEKKAKELYEKLKSGADFASLLPKEPGQDNILGEDYAWLKKGGLPAEFKAFEDKAFSLAPGETSEPVRTSIGFHVIQTKDKKAPAKIPLDDVKEEIRATVAEEKGADRLTKVLDATHEKILGGENLKTAAESEGLTVTDTDFFSKDQLPPALKLSEQSTQILFNLPKDGLTDNPLNTDDGFILAKVVDVKPEGFSTLDEVKDRISATLIAEEAMKKAKAKADETAKALQNDADKEKVLAEYKDKIVVSEPFSRRGFIPALGMVPPLAQAAFDSKQKGWFPEAFGVSDGYVVAELDKRTPPPAEAWEQSKEKVLASLLQEKQKEFFQAYLQALKAEATFKPANTDILGPEPGQTAALDANQDK